MPAFVFVAFALGLMGSLHCIAMCGGVLGILSAGVSTNLRVRPHAHVRLVIAYNVGRIGSYAVFGAMIGVLSLGLRHALGDAQVLLRVAAGFFTIALGLRLSGLLPGSRWIERLLVSIWRRVSPLAGRLVPVTSVPRALALGALWGWVPCGMVYAALALATASGNPIVGASWMAAFGAGTLPAMVLTGTVAGQVLAVTGKAWVRLGAGAILAAFGATTALTAMPGPLALHRDQAPHLCIGRAL